MIYILVFSFLYKLYKLITEKKYKEQKKKKKKKKKKREYTGAQPSSTHDRWCEDASRSDA
jgi:hypothetical protein